MNLTFSTYEAKARFSEVIRLVREGRTVHISYHGKPVASAPSRGKRRRSKSTSTNWSGGELSRPPPSRVLSDLGPWSADRARSSAFLTNANENGVRGHVCAGRHRFRRERSRRDGPAPWSLQAGSVVKSPGSGTARRIGTGRCGLLAFLCGTNRLDLSGSATRSRDGHGPGGRVSEGRRPLACGDCPGCRA